MINKSKLMLIGTVAALLTGGSSLAMAQQYGGPNGSQPLVTAPAGGPAYAGPYAYSYEQLGPFDWAPSGYGGGWPPGSAASILYNIHTPPNH
jgi:hypothetical protein